MNHPKVSVIIPAYNSTDFLGEAIQSVLNQTYSNFEIIVVDDASSEPVGELVKKFTDSRIQLIRHENNRGAVAARLTGVKASSGERIAFLDQDDLFHEEKLQNHVEFLLQHSECGLTYNPRFHIQGSSRVIRGLSQPPQHLTLADWVLGFPLAPSDIVLAREWARREEIWDDTFASQAEHVIFNGHEIVFGGRLALAGCKFGYVSRALNYRRFHPHRVLKHLDLRCKAELACQNLILNDPRCPSHVLALRNVAAANIYVLWAFTAYLQQEFAIGREFIQRAVNLMPDLAEGEPPKLVETWTNWIAVDEERDIEDLLSTIFANLPPEVKPRQEYFPYAVSRGYLLRGMHAFIWGLDAQTYLERAVRMGARVDEQSVVPLVRELAAYEAEFGSEATETVVRNLIRHFRKLGQSKGMRLLSGIYAANRAFRWYYAGQYAQVPRQVIRTLAADPKYLANKGVLSILARALARRVGLGQTRGEPWTGALDG